MNFYLFVFATDIPFAMLHDYCSPICCYDNISFSLKAASLLTTSTSKSSIMKLSEVCSVASNYVTTDKSGFFCIKKCFTARPSAGIFFWGRSDRGETFRSSWNQSCFRCHKAQRWNSSGEAFDNVPLATSALFEHLYSLNSSFHSGVQASRSLASGESTKTFWCLKQ